MIMGVSENTLILHGGEGGIMSYEVVSYYISISYAVYSPSLYNFCTIFGHFLCKTNI